MLGERRLPNTLVRLIEPFVSRTTDNDAPGMDTLRGKNNPMGDGTGGKISDPLSYVERTALSMVLFLRETCVCGINEMRFQLSLMNNTKNQQYDIDNQNFHSKLNDANFSGVGKRGDVYQTNYETPVLQSQRTPTANSSSSGSRGNNNNPVGQFNRRNLIGEFESGKHNEGSDYKGNNSPKKSLSDGKSGDSISLPRLSSACVALKAAISMASQPSLRRLIIAGGECKTQLFYLFIHLLIIYLSIYGFMTSFSHTLFSPDFVESN